MVYTLKVQGKKAIVSVESSGIGYAWSYKGKI